MGQTILKATGNSAIAVGSVPWLAQWPATHNVTSGAVRGSSSVTLADGTSGINIGELMVIEQPNIGNVFGYGAGPSGNPTYLNQDRMNNGTAVLHLRVMVTGKDGSTVNFTPPLPYSFDGSPRAVGYGGTTGSNNFGIESLTINGSISNVGIDLVGCYGAWVKDVEVTNFQVRGIRPQWSARLEFRGCYFHEGFYGHDHGYAFEANSANHMLIEDNIWYKCQAGLFLQGGSSANVVAYNALFYPWNQDSGTDWMAPVFEACHSPYPMYNLFEGNYGNAFQSDFYYGGSRYGPLLRNYLPGTDPTVTQHRIVVQIDARQWDYNVVGNILGEKSAPASIFLKMPNATLNFVQSAPIAWTYGATEYRSIFLCCKSDFSTRLSQGRQQWILR